MKLMPHSESEAFWRYRLVPWHYRLVEAVEDFGAGKNKGNEKKVLDERSAI